MPSVFDPVTGRRVKNEEEEQQPTLRGTVQQRAPTTMPRDNTPRQRRSFRREEAFDLTFNPEEVREQRAKRSRAEEGLVKSGLRAGVAQVSAGAEGLGATIAGAVGGAEGEAASYRLAREAQQSNRQAATYGPQASLSDVARGDKKFSEWVVGGVAQQIPNLAVTFGTAAVTGGVGGLLARGAANAALTGGSRVAAKAYRMAGDDLLKAQQGFRAAALRNRTTGGAAQPSLTSAAADVTAKRQVLERVEQQADEMLIDLIKRRNGAFAKRASTAGPLGGAAAGSTVAASQAPSFILDPESDSTLRARSFAALAGAGAEGLTEMLPVWGIMRNLGLGKTAGHLVAKEVSRRGALGTAAVGAAKQAGAEAAQEVSAEFLMNAAHRTINDNIELLSNEALMQYLEAGLLGWIIGGGMGGVTSIRFPSPGASVQRFLERRSANEVEQQRKEYEELDPEIRAQRAARTPDEALSEAAFGHIGTLVLEGTQAGQTVLQSMAQEELPAYRDQVTAALLLLTDTTHPGRQQLFDGETTGEQAAQQLVDTVFGEEAPMALMLAKRHHKAALKFRRDFARANGREDVAQQLDDQLNAIDAIDETQEGEQTGLDFEDVNQQQVEATAFTLPLNNEGAEPINAAEVLSGANRIKSPRFGPVFVSPRATSAQDFDNTPGVDKILTRTLDKRLRGERGALRAQMKDAPEARKAELREEISALDEQINELTSLNERLGGKERDAEAEQRVRELGQETGYVARPLGEIAERVIRRDVGLDPSDTSLNHADAQKLLIDEARTINSRLPESNKNRREQINTREEALDFLNQFDTIIREDMPRALRGDAQALTEGDLEVQPLRTQQFKTAVERAKTQGDTVRLQNLQAMASRVKELNEQIEAAEKTFADDRTLPAAKKQAAERLPDLKAQLRESRNSLLEAMSSRRHVLERMPRGRRLGATQIRVMDPRGNKERALNLVQLTKTMLGKMDVGRTGKTESQEASQQRGARIQQEGKSGEKPSIQDVGEALLAGLAELRARGFQFHEVEQRLVIPANTVVQRYSDADGNVEQEITFAEVTDGVSEELRAALNNLQSAAVADKTGGVTDAMDEAQAEVAISKTGRILAEGQTKRRKRVSRMRDTAQQKEAELRKRLARVEAVAEKISAGVHSKTLKQLGPDGVLRAVRKKIAELENMAAPDSRKAIMLPMRYRFSSPQQLRPGIRDKYKGSGNIADLIARGDRTGTTRNVPSNVRVGALITFPGVEGTYEVTSIDTVNLDTEAGRKAWEEAEGWSLENTNFGSQVRTGAKQIRWKRADTQVTHADKELLTQLKSLERFWSQTEQQRKESRKKLADKTKELQEEIRYQNAFVKGLILAQEVDKATKRSGLHAPNRTTRMANLLREFTKQELDAEFQIAEESETDAQMNLPRIFGEVVKRVKQPLAPPWMRSGRDSPTASLLSLIQSGALYDFVQLHKKQGLDGRHQTALHRNIEQVIREYSREGGRSQRERSEFWKSLMAQQSNRAATRTLNIPASIQQDLKQLQRVLQNPAMRRQLYKDLNALANGEQVTEKSPALKKRTARVYKWVQDELGLTLGDNTNTDFRDYSPPVYEDLKAETDLLQTLTKKLDLDLSIRVVDWVEFMELSNYSEADLAANDALVHLERNKQGRTTAVVWVNEEFSAGSEARIAALYHEMGHAVLMATTSKATDAEVGAIWSAYRKWVADQKDRKVPDALKSRRALLNLVNVKKGDMRTVANLPENQRRELLDFQEWFADQVARYLESSPQARQAATEATRNAPGPIRKFFRTLATRLSKLRDLMRTDGQPETSVQSFLDRLWTAKEGSSTDVRKFDMWGRIERQGNALADPDNQTAIEKLVAEIASTGGKFLTGKSIRAQGRLIQGSNDMTNAPFSIEAFHGVKDLLVAKLTAQERKVLARAFTTPAVRRQIIDELHTAGYDSESFLDNAYDLMAVGYQLWLADRLKLGPKAESLYTQLHRAAHRVANATTNTEQATQLLKAIADNRIAARKSVLHEAAKDGSHLKAGKYVVNRRQIQTIGTIASSMGSAGKETIAEDVRRSEGFENLSPEVADLIAEDIKNGVFSPEFVNTMARKSEFVLNPDKDFILQINIKDNPDVLQKTIRGIFNAGHILTNSNFGRLVLSEAMRARMTKNAEIENFLNDIFTDVTTQGRKESMLSRKTRRRGEFNGQYHDIVEELTEEQQVELRDVMHQRRQASSPEVKAAEQRLRALLTRLRNYATNANLNMGKIENYFPWVFDPLKIEAQAKEIMTSWGDKRFHDDWERLAINRGLIDKQETLSIEQKNRMIRATIDQISTLNNGLADVTGRPELNQLDPAPHVGAMNTRELSFLWDKGRESDKTLLSELMADDINSTMAAYISQIVKRAEYTRTFGRDGEKFQERIARARELGATDADVDLMQKTLHSAMGTIGLEVAPFWKAALEPINSGIRRKLVKAKSGRPFTSKGAAERKLARMKTGGTVIAVDGGYAIQRDLVVDPRRFRQLQSGLVVYQNFRLLIGAALTNIADLAGVYARTGDAQVAWEGYKQSVKEVWASWNNRKLTPKERRRRRSEQMKAAEEMGAIEAALLSDQLGQFYGSAFMSGGAKAWNDKLFRWNGMEALTRTTRLAGVTAARRYVTNHTVRALDGEAESVDALRAIDLEPSDVVLSGDGELELLTQEEVFRILDPLGLTVADVTQKKIAEYEGETAAQLGRVRKDDRTKRAMFRMVDESVLRPSATQRPTWMNDPNWLIFSHLKGFMYTYHERVLRRAYTSAAAGNYAPALYMLSYVPVIMAADLLRELIQHGPGGDERKDRWTLFDRVLDGVHRSGIGGAFNLIPDMMKTHQLGKNPLVEVAGPTVGHVNDWMRALGGVGNTSFALKRSLPASQLLVDVPSNWTEYLYNGHVDEDSPTGALARSRVLDTYPLTTNAFQGE